jgi:ribosomal protein S18 acetylase RimI-like enzyme
MPSKHGKDGLALLPFDGDSPRLADAIWLYNQVWGGDSKELSLLHHLGYPGFKGVVATTPEGRIAGAVYGYTDLPRQWWHNHVAAVLGPQETERALTGTFTVSELAVTQEHRRRGLGRLLLRTVLDGLPHTAATLSTQSDNVPARRLYESEGWQYLIYRMCFYADGPDYMILRRELPLAPR